jgi:hypothetical protein
MTGVFGTDGGASKIQQRGLTMTRKKTPGSVASAADRAPKPPIATPTLTESHIARRAYDLYLARGGEHGQDVDDWLRAERELHSVVGSNVA